MKQKTLFILWGVGFIVCAALGFIHEPEGALRIVMVGLALTFFVLGGMLLYRAMKAGDRRTLALIRNLSALSLGLTVVLLVGNFLSVLGPELLGDMMYSVLIIVSSPMVCSQYWAVSLFLWACLLLTSLSALRKK